MKWIVFTILLVLTIPTVAESNQYQKKIVAKPVYSEQTARSFQGQHVLINLLIAGPQGPLTIELANNTSQTFGVYNFNLSILGGSGLLEFSNLAPGVKARRIINLPTLRELKVADIIAFSAEADELFPRTIVQYVYPKNMKKSHFVSRR